MPDRQTPPNADLTASTAAATARCSGAWSVAVWLFVAGSVSFGETYTETFDSPNPSWTVMQSEPGARTVTHRRSTSYGKEGSGEFLRIQTERSGQKVRVAHALPEVRALDELELKLWVKADPPGLQVNLRVVLPEYKDPGTGRTLAMLIPGDVQEAGGDWQHLSCRTVDKLVQEQLGLMRARQKRAITPKMLKVDKVILTWTLSRGVNELSLDELNFGPLVRFDEPEISTLGHEQEVMEDAPVEIRLDRLEVEKQPFFTRMVPYHGEPLKTLADAGFNVVWVPSYNDRALLRSVRREGLWAAAMPPVPSGTDGDEVQTHDVGLMPFSDETRSIAFWMLGTRIAPQMQSRLSTWIDQIQAADHKYHRPLAADISGEERVFSKELDLVGISRHTIGSSLTLTQYRDWLSERGSWARPGSHRWTWIQTAPSPAISAIFEAHQVPLQLEPEQIRLQVYAALAAGVRGVGFWTPHALNEDHPADRETLEALRQINWELELLEPWLATANGVMVAPITIPVETAAAPQPKSRFRLNNNSEEARWEREAMNRNRAALRQAAQQVNAELTAAVLRADNATLLLPMWLEGKSQFVPGRLGAEKISITVPGVAETASVWELTTTGIHNLDRDRERVSGGVKLTLRNFDQTACILLTSNPNLIQRTRQRAAEHQELCARSYLLSAELKLNRVRDIDQKLGERGLRQPDGPQVLGAARGLFLEAQAAVSQQDWPRVRQKSRQAMQMARVLQRAHWDNAVENLPSPVASPWATSFQALPEQARLAFQLAQDHASVGKNLLPSGNFEDVHAQTEALGWKHEQDSPDGVQASAALDSPGHNGTNCLRLRAESLQQLPRSTCSGRELVSYITPPITVHAGQAVRIAGWIKVPEELQSSEDGVMIYDSLMTRGSALRFREASPWQRFELVREVLQSQDVTVTIALTGLGEVRIDDLEVTVHPLADIAPAAARGPSNRPRPAADNTLWPDWSRLNPLAPRNAQRGGTPPGKR